MMFTELQRGTRRPTHRRSTPIYLAPKSSQTLQPPRNGPSSHLPFFSWRERMRGTRTSGVARVRAQSKVSKMAGEEAQNAQNYLHSPRLKTQTSQVACVVRLACKALPVQI